LSDRAVTRHRAPQRAVTPLSEIGEALTGQLATVGRSGAIVALSTGLVASVSVPAQALTEAAPAGISSVDTAATTTLALSPMSTGRSGLISAPSLARGTVIAAPSAATVTFETGAFKAVPAPVERAVAPRAGTGSSTDTSSGTSGRSSVAAPSVAPGGAVTGSRVLAVAARYVGIPYLYGGTTPRGFDCSGFTGYVYRQLGVSLPRTANEQLQATKRISRSEARPGDLVFFVSSGRAYHNGIYAGGNMMYDSPRSGKTLQKREIWSADVVFTRVTG
jgi:cell wall-associated NlpC family hydrolase